jgi:predicted GTPase
VAVTAVRTGSGKSQTTRYVAKLLTDAGKKVAIIRHPMPYGNLEEQICMRFALMKIWINSNVRLRNVKNSNPILTMAW